jgi:cytosine/adenosine deaminase-related metal-dependent hydrolase
VGNAEAVQDAVQAVYELLIQRVVQVGTTTAVLGYSRAGSVWYVTQVAASSTTACAGAEEVPWGGGRLIIVTAVYGSQSGPRGGSSSGVDLAAIATEHACRLIATFDPSEVRTVIHVAVYEHLPR